MCCWRGLCVWLCGSLLACLLLLSLSVLLFGVLCVSLVVLLCCCCLLCLLACCVVCVARVLLVVACCVVLLAGVVCCDDVGVGVVSLLRCFVLQLVVVVLLSVFVCVGAV